MDTPQTDNETVDKPKPRMPPADQIEGGPEISLTRKIIVAIFILGFWIFFYWFQDL